MTRHRKLLGLSLTGLIAACSAETQSPVSDGQDVETVPVSMITPPPAPRAANAVATMINRSGAEIGSAALYQGTDGLIIRLAVNGLAPGVHGMHFHAIGTCEDAADGFKATGGHVMPLGKPHGYMNPGGPHAGNLPNLIVAADGTANVELHTHLVSLTEDPANLLDADGSTLIIHENEDDHITQPIGGAGGRIACGVIKAPS